MTPPAPAISLSAIYLYPVKSCAGLAVAAAYVEPRGLRADRRYMVVTPEGCFLTQRELPALALLRPVPTCAAGQSASDAAEAGLPLGFSLTAADLPPLPLPAVVSAADRPSRRVQIWDDQVDAIDVGSQAAEWLTAALKHPCRLVYMPEDTRRPVDPHYSTLGDHVSFADGYPLLLLSEASLQDLNQHLPPGEPAVDMDRFRPNLVVRGCSPYAEDHWADMRLGAVALAGVKLCARCTIPNVDQRSAAVGREPLRTLARQRRQGNNVFFGQNVIPRDQGWLRVGDALTTLA